MLLALAFLIDLGLFLCALPIQLVLLLPGILLKNVAVDVGALAAHLDRYGLGPTLSAHQP